MKPGICLMIASLMLISTSLQAESASPSVPKPGDHEQSIDVAGRARTYLLHLPPAYEGRRKLPLVIVLHGGGGAARGTARMTGFTEKADKEGFIVVYPNGTGRFEDRLLTWNTGNCCGYALDHQVDDVAFVRALIDHLEKNYRVDPKRVYATGISNGGMMAYRLACELSDKIAAIAPVAGAMNMENCTPTYPVSVIIFHGSADLHVLYDGGAPKLKADWHPRIDKPVSYAVSFWVKHDGCTATLKRTEKGNIISETYSSGRNGTEVELYTIKGGSHAWPGGKAYPFGDEPTHELSATDAMWEFFARHPKK